MGDSDSSLKEHGNHLVKDRKGWLSGQTYMEEPTSIMQQEWMSLLQKGSFPKFSVLCQSTQACTANRIIAIPACRAGNRRQLEGNGLW